jgi:hypothetical protein
MVRRSAAFAAGLLLVVVAGACGERGGGAALTPPTSITPPLPSPSPTTPPTEPSPSPSPDSGSPLKRHDAPPEGVAEQLGFTLPAAGPCKVTLTPGDTPDESEPTPELTVVSTHKVCFEGFAARSIHIVVTQADGSQVRVVDMPADVAWSATFYPGEPKGEHTLEATQESLAAVWRFNLVAPSNPVGIAIPSTGPAGTTFAIALAGFDPGSEVTMLLYQLDPGTSKWIFRTVMESASVDGQGESTYMLATEPDDPTGTYRVLTDPRSSLIQFTVAT